MTFADKLFYNGTIATVNDAFDFAQAVAVKDGKILAVGTNDDILTMCNEHTEKIDLNGAFMLPGIHDSHVHASDFINSTESLDCSKVETVAELKALIAERKKTGASVIAGNNLTNAVLDKGLTCLDLDEAAGDTPVMLVMWHGHGCAVNSVVLKNSGITKDTPTPAGTTVGRFENGEPTGILQEFGAMQLASAGIPRLTAEDIRRNLIKMQQLMNSMGYTAYTECTVGPGNNEGGAGASGEKCLEAYQMMLRDNELTCRVSIGFYSAKNGTQSAEALKNDLERGAVPVSENKDWLKFNMLKFFCDGVHLSNTAWMKNDYLNAPGNHGFSAFNDGTMTDKEQEKIIREILSIAHRSGHQIGIHTIGDRAVKVAAEAIIDAQNSYPREDCRHYLIHADSCGDIEDIKKCAENGIYISVQPNLAEEIYEASLAIVGEKAEKLMALRQMTDCGCVVAGGSDTIAGEYHTWQRGIRCAVERRSVSGKLYRQDLALTMEEAIRLYTINAAKQEFAEDVRGSIEIGKFADFTVVDKNLFDIPPRELDDVKVVMTVVDGDIVYRR